MIAADEMVLTDAGLVPMTHLKKAHKLWDGVNWVSHDGVVELGEMECVTYDGLTATLNQQVWTQIGEEVSLAYAKMKNFRLMRTAHITTPIEFNILYPATTGPFTPSHTQDKYLPVYSVVNAGPHHRFTVSGKLVKDERGDIHR